MSKSVKILFFGTILFIVAVIGICVLVKPKPLEEEQIISIVKENMQVEYLKIDSISLKDDRYEVSFKHDNNDYTYYINYETGEIESLKFNEITTTTKKTTTKKISKKDKKKTTTKKAITLDKAKDIALKHAKLELNDVEMEDVKQDNKNIYKVIFKYDNYKYTYEINVIRGNIASFIKEK